MFPLTDLGDRSRWHCFPSRHHQQRTAQGVPAHKESSGYVSDVESEAVPILMNGCAENVA